MSKSSNRHRAGYDAFNPQEPRPPADPSFIMGWEAAKEDFEFAAAQQAEIDDSLAAIYLDEATDIGDLKRWLHEYVVPHLIKGN